MPEIHLQITNKVGLHARPAALFVQEANKFSSDITVICGDESGDAKSILDLLMLGVSQGSSITVQAEGEDAEQALAAIAALHQANFGEKNDGSISLLRNYRSRSVLII